MWFLAQVVWINRALRKRGFRNTQELLRQRQLPNSLIDDLEPTDLARYIAAAARYTIGAKNSCLRRSLLLWWLLDKQGIDCELRMGLTKSDSKLIGHAWVEIDGIAINDSADVGEKYPALQSAASEFN